MRDTNVKKDNDGLLKIIAIVVLSGAAILVVAAFGVGFVMWWLMRPAQPQTPPGPVATVWPPGQPMPQPPGFPGQLQPLPPVPILPGKPPLPQQPSHKRVDIKPVRSFEGHAGPVFSVALSPDERRLVSAGNDKTVRLWDLETGKELARLEGHGDAIRAVAFTPDGKRVVSASQDGTLRLWDLADKKTLRTFKGHDGGVLCAAFTPDGKQLLSGGADRSLRVWDVETGKQIHEWYGHDAAVLCVAVSADGAYALTGSADGGAMHWELETGRELCYLSVDKPVHFALFTPDGQRAAIGGDAASRLCDLSTGEQWSAQNGLAEPLRGAALLPGDTVVLQGAGKRLESRFLPARHAPAHEIVKTDRNQLGEVEAHRGAITCVRVSHDGRLALTAGEDGFVKLWRISERDADERRAN